MIAHSQRAAENPALLSRVRCFLLDMDGTFYLGDRLIDGALDFIDTVQRQGKRYVFLTNNSSRSRTQYVEKLTRLGLTVDEQKVFTSGEATALYLQKQKPGARLFLAGTPGLEDEFRRHGFELVQENPDLIVLGFDTTLTYNKLWKFCDFVRAGLPYFATHPDLTCPTLNGSMPDTGSMIALIEAATGRKPDLIIGKPNRMIVDALAEKLGLPLDTLAMIGDRLHTDIALGETSGILTVLVLTGETKAADISGSPHQPDYVFNHIGEVAVWLCEHPVG